MEYLIVMRSSHRSDEAVDCLLLQKHDGEWGDCSACEPWAVHFNISSQHAAARV